MLSKHNYYTYANLKKNPNTIDMDGTTPLMHAAKENKIETVKFLLSHDNTDVNALNLDGYTAIMYASLYQHIEIVQLLLPKSELIHINEEDESALYLAKKRNNDLLITILKEGHANQFCQEAIQLSQCELENLLVRHRRAGAYLTQEFVSDALIKSSRANQSYSMSISYLRKSIQQEKNGDFSNALSLFFHLNRKLFEGKQAQLLRIELEIERLNQIIEANKCVQTENCDPVELDKRFSQLTDLCKYLEQHFPREIIKHLDEATKTKIALLKIVSPEDPMSYKVHLFNKMIESFSRPVTYIFFKPPSVLNISLGDTEKYDAIAIALLKYDGICKSIDSGYYLWIAVKKKCLGIVTAMLRHPDVDVNYRPSNYTEDHEPLATAILNQDIEMVKALLQHGNINVNIMYYYDTNHADDRDWIANIASRFPSKEIYNLLVNHRSFDPKLYDLHPDDKSNINSKSASKETWIQMYPLPNSSAPNSNSSKTTPIPGKLT